MTTTPAVTPYLDGLCTVCDTTRGQAHVHDCTMGLALTLTLDPTTAEYLGVPPGTRVTDLDGDRLIALALILLRVTHRRTRPKTYRMDVDLDRVGTPIWDDPDLWMAGSWWLLMDTRPDLHTGLVDLYDVTTDTLTQAREGRLTAGWDL